MIIWVEAVKNDLFIVNIREATLFNSIEWRKRIYVAYS